MDNRSYWSRRQSEREAHWHELTTAEMRKLKRYYVKAATEIERDVAALYAKFATENGLSMTAARKLIRGDEFAAWRMTLEEYVKRSKADPAILRELNTLAMRSRISRLEALHARTLMETIDLAERLQETADAHLARAYLETYYGNLYDLHRTVGLSIPPNAIDAKRVESVLQTTWLGKNYSSRIWTNQAKLARELEATMLQAIHRGSSIQQLSKALSRRMDVAYSNAERLVRTELNAVENRASAEAMKTAEFTHYQFMATLDRRTCARCGERDGEVYKLSEMNQGENAPPMHARCRCTIVAYDGGGNGQRVAGRERLPEGVTYKQWRARYIDGAEMARKTTNELPYQPVSEERYNQLIIPLKKMGVTIHRDEQSARYLEIRNAEADTIGTHDVLFGKNVSISAILEETHHIRQNRRGMNDDKGIALRSILNEIDAKKYLLRVASKYGIPRAEIEATKIQLKQYEDALRNYMGVS